MEQETITSRIYSFKGQVSLVLCDKCADTLFFKLCCEIVKINPGCSIDEYEKLDAMKTLNRVDINAVSSRFKCRPTFKNKLTGLPICFSEEFPNIPFDRIPGDFYYSFEEEN